ncbi:hypothetical protein BCV70DRAFT_197038 [Testicularia cyperi]|uniref:Uncharacterized protein n=1 Tax=Testicularia cyperi TaxID=1882483 RepID=A0A317XXZ4_9BASI|nr:hypothetical protein BCV70DRAFT_197038 [Testicularia cyperi]
MPDGSIVLTRLSFFLSLSLWVSLCLCLVASHLTLSSPRPSLFPTRAWPWRELRIRLA